MKAIIEPNNLYVNEFGLSLIHHQDVICGVDFDRSGLRRMKKV
jgi:hypothetical protein